MPIARRILAGPLAYLLVLVVVLLGCGTSGEPVIEVGRARSAPPVAGSSQVVFRVTNTGSAADTLTGAETPAAAGAELHRTTIEDGRAEMRPVDEVEIAPGETVEFRPGGLHLMLVVPDQNVATGGTFELTLQFERTGEVTFPVSVVDLLDLVETDRENASEPDG